MRQQFLGISVNFSVMASCERKACELCPAGGVTIEDVECYTISHAGD